MSAPTSTSSPRAGSISDEGFFAFDGAEALLTAWGGGLKPDPLLTVSEWADRYRMLSSRAAALIAAELGLDPAAMQKVLEAHVRAHLDELAEGRLDLG